MCITHMYIYVTHVTYMYHAYVHICDTVTHMYHAYVRVCDTYV